MSLRLPPGLLSAASALALGLASPVAAQDAQTIQRAATIRPPGGSPIGPPRRIALDGADRFQARRVPVGLLPTPRAGIAPCAGEPLFHLAHTLVRQFASHGSRPPSEGPFATCRLPTPDADVTHLLR
ncbi:hypothetical protein, partial [Burkholderia cenocepacia]|uniref:hypothetical protein n=1 Tax=Burkholderia cenocepacia TaxID=95486 RepID=UPI00406C3243